MVPAMKVMVPAKAILNKNPAPYMLLRHIPTCMLHVCNANDRISCFFIPWLRLWHGGHVENCRHIVVSGTRTFFLKSKEYLSKSSAL